MVMTGGGPLDLKNVNLSQKNDSKQKKPNRKAPCDHLCLLVTKLIKVLGSQNEWLPWGRRRGERKSERESPTWTSVMFPASGQSSEGLGHSLTNVRGVTVTFCFAPMYII